MVTLQAAGPGCQFSAQLLCLVLGAPQLQGQCFHGQIMNRMSPSSCAEISPSFQIRQHHSGKRAMQSSLLYLNFYPGS